MQEVSWLLIAVGLRWVHAQKEAFKLIENGGQWTRYAVGEYVSANAESGKVSMYSENKSR